MTKENLSIFLVVAFISLIFSYFITASIFTPSSSRNQEVERVNAITATFPTPNKQYFNANSVNPVQTIQIGGNQNENPFTNINPN